MAEAHKASAIASASSFTNSPIILHRKYAYIHNLFRNDVFDRLKAWATGFYRPEAVSRDLLFRPCGSVAISMVMPSSLQWRISYSEHDHADSTGLAWLAQAASQSAGLSREFHDSLRCIYSSNPSPQALSWRRVVPIDLPPDPGMS